MEYCIENITDYNGNIKPERIGRIVRPAEKDDPLMTLLGFGGQIFYYSDGAGAFVTSPIKSITKGTDNVVKMMTENSIYYLKELRYGKN